MKIRTQLNLTTVCLIGIAVLGFVYIVADEIRPRYREAQEDVLVDFAETLATLLTRTSVEINGVGEALISPSKLAATYRELGERKLDSQIYSLRKTKVDTRIYITDKKGIVIFDSDNGREEGKNYSRWRDVRLTLQGKYGARTTDKDPIYPEGPTMYVSRPITYAGKIIGVLSVGKPTRNLETFTTNLSKSLWLTGAVVALFFALIGFLTYRSLMRPLTKIQQYATDVSQGVKTSRPNIGDNEIGDVEKALEDMRRSLDGKQYIEGYIQSLTHELKAPLAGIQGAAELLREPLSPEKQLLFLNNIHGQTARLHGLIDRLLILAKIESTEDLETTKAINVSQLINEVVAAYTDYAASNQVRLVTSLIDVMVLGDYFLLSQALGNLVKNAVEHATLRSDIQINCEKRSTKVFINVINVGKPIPSFALDKVFNRFYSMSNPRGGKGSGIGLSFAKEVAKLHNGSVDIKNLPSQQVMASLVLPIQQLKQKIEPT